MPLLTWGASLPRPVPVFLAVIFGQSLSVIPSVFCSEWALTNDRFG